MSKIIVTGAAGFIGTHLVRYCLEQGHDVLGIDKFWPKEYAMAFEFFKRPGSHIECLDIRDKRLDQYFRGFQPDVCYHLAAYASEGRSNHIRSFIHQNNTVGTANVINACVNHKCKLVFTSSVAVYSGSPPFTEAMTPNPIDEYGLSKYMSERSIQIAAETQGLEYCIIRPRNVYGPGQNLFDRSRNLFGIWMYNALNNLPCLIYGDGLQGRSFTYIDDIIPCLYNAEAVNKEIINLGASSPWTVEAAATIFKMVTGYNNFQHTEPRHEVAEAFCNVNKSIAYLGFGISKETDIKTGLTKMWEWAKTVPMRPLDQMPELECHINAHSSLKP